MPDREMQEGAEQIARAFHDAYERLAPLHGYETREASAKPWDDVPEQNRQLMTAAVFALLDTGVIARSTAYPYAAEDGTRILGPGITASPDSSAVSWDGVTYVLPGEDQDEAPAWPKDAGDCPWRVGRSVGRTIYAITGGDDRKADTLIGVMDTPQLALDVVTARNTAEARLAELRETAGRVRESLENTAAGMILSADTSRPSKKSEIEDGCARAIVAIAAQLPGAASEP